jgi:hypothetical protein
MVAMDTADMGTAMDIGTATDITDMGTATDTLISMDMGTTMGMDMAITITAMIGTGITVIGVMAAGGMVAGGRTVSAPAGCGHPTGGTGTAIKMLLQTRWSETAWDSVSCDRDPLSPEIASKGAIHEKVSRSSCFNR